MVENEFVELRGEVMINNGKKNDGGIIRMKMKETKKIDRSDRSDRSYEFPRDGLLG